MGQFIREHGIKQGILGKGMVYSSGLMVADMRATGNRIRLMAKASSFMPMETSILVSGKMIEHTVLEHILILMALSMKANGNSINSMDTERRSGLMEQNTRENSQTVTKRAKES